MKKAFIKLLSIIFIFAMSAPIIDTLGANVKEVQAEETQTVGYVIVPSSAVTITVPTDTKEPKVMSVKSDNEQFGKYADYVFAGWYTDQAATKAAPSGTTEKILSDEITAYARFVPAGVLNTKVQVTNGIVTETTNENYRNKYVMRFVSSVDSKNYKHIGFELSYTDKDTDEKVTLTSTTTKVFKRIDSTTGATNATDNNVDTYEFSPKVVDTKSTYFFTSKYSVAPDDVDVNYTVTAYWMTKDGTKVYGSERCVSVEDGINKKGLNITVDKELTKGTSYTAFFTNRDGGQETVFENNVEVLTTGNGYSNVRLKGATRDLKSVTTIQITDGAGTTAMGVYRNLYTKYEGQDDITWYEAYKNTTDEFVIATSADLYGLSTIVTTNRISLAGKKIYLVSDINLNPEKLELLEGENHLKWYTWDENGQKNYKDVPTYAWTPIGDNNKYFDGIFDGGMHTISGLYMSTSKAFAGLFGTTRNDSIVQKLKLKDSYIKSTSTDVGSIAGLGAGAFYSVYSDAILECAGSRSGGLIGVVKESTDTKLTNCWFAGTLKNTKQVSGGLIGDTFNSTKVTMDHCMFSGVLDFTACGDVIPYSGGFIGQVGHGQAAEIILKDSFVTGKIYADTTKNGYGSTLGYVYAKTKSTITNTYYTEASCARSITIYSEEYSGLPTQVKGALTGNEASNKMPNLDWDTSWTSIEYGSPVLTMFKQEAFDTSWYNEDKMVYVLKDIGDFYGFAELSKEINFAGKTVKLANDIIINAGSAEDWAAGKVPDNIWTPIGSEGATGSNNVFVGTAFAGTFDGGMHTISGIYHNTSARYSGMFGATASSAEIKNLKLKNSYFKSTFAGYSYFGSVVGSAQGTFDSIFSDAIVNVVGDAAAGMIGGTQGKATINNCLYAGTFTNSGTNRQGHAGIVGYTASNSVVNLSNCLNTGTISSKSTAASPWLAGMIGGCEGSTIAINNCLNVGLIQSAAGTTKDFGSIIGGHLNCKAIEIDQATTIGTEESSTYNSSAYEITVLAERNLIGNKATSAVHFDWDSTWQVVDYKTPTLQTFSDEEDKRIDVEWYANATGSEEDPYILMDAEDLYGFAMVSKTDNFAGKFVTLGTDIVVNKGTPSAEWLKSNYREWEPISMTGVDGSKYATMNEFAGTFDGDMHTISGLYYVTDVRYGGLFVGTATTANIKNLKLENSYFKSTFGGNELKYGFFGSLVGSAKGNFDTIYADITMDAGTSAVGGIIGGFRGTGSANNCWFAGTVKNTNAAQQIHGGVVGVVYTAKVDISNCLNTGTISTNSTRANWVAGILGGADTLNLSTPVTVTNCLNVGLIQHTPTYTTHFGPIIGSHNSDKEDEPVPTITNSYATSESCTKNPITGATVSSERNFIGATAQTTMQGFDFTDTWSTVEYKTPVLKSFANEVDKRIDVDWYTKAEGTEGDPYILKDAADLYGFAIISRTDNFADKFVKLGADIVVNEGTPSASWTQSNYRQWQPIGMTGVDGSNHATMTEFAGTFDGDMHTISGVYYVTDIRYGGLFVGTATTATIKNLKLKNSYFKESFAGYSYFGGLVGSTKGTIQTIYADITVDADSSAVGGIIGGFRASGCKVVNCWFAGTVTNINADRQIHGGIAGYAYQADATITNCLNTGTISTNATGTNWIGGIIGGPEKSTVSITNCLNVGLIQQASGQTKFFGPIGGHYDTTAPSISNSYATEESCTYAPFSGVTTYSETDFLGVLAKSKLQGFDFDNTWETVEFKTPVLKSFADETDKRVDVSWYDAEKDVFTLYDAADLYGFAMISTTTNFKDKTVKLGADIVVNSGEPSSEWTKSNYRQWQPIGISGSSFAGTFDGQGHTISGLYINTTARNVGFFGYIGSDGVVQNFNLTNSYFKSSNKDFGGVAGAGYGSFYRIYCDVDLEGSQAGTGGLIGQAGGTKNQTIANCWFDGTVTNTSNSTQDIGGFIGAIYANSVKMYNCLNTGVVDVSQYNTTTQKKVSETETVSNVSPIVGGFVGNFTGGELILHQCVNLSEIRLHDSADLGFGPFVGYSKHFTNVTISGSYTTSESCDMTNKKTLLHNNFVANYTVVSETDVLSNKQTQQDVMRNLGWGLNWEARDNDSPSIKFDYSVSGSGVDYSANDQDERVLNDKYAGRVLYKGDMHAHADNGGNSDGTYTLEKWEEQMGDTIDFVASLDHRQLNHINHEDWKTSKFVYGSEAQVTITDIVGGDDKNENSGYLHFDMLFKTREQFETVVKEYRWKFMSIDLETFSYTFLKFTKAEFAEFINFVINTGGFINIAHPMQSHGDNGEKYSSQLEDYYFELQENATKQLIYGFQVVNASYGAGNTTQNLSVWKELLESGKRFYATAGTDSHSYLTYEALTSIYGTTCNSEGEKCTKNCSDPEKCAGGDKGNLITYLQKGDYAVGNMGIKMCIYGEDGKVTSMGGSCNFSENKRLVILLEDILYTRNLELVIPEDPHSFASDHIYRVDVLNESGVVYSQYINPSQTTTIALDIEDCGFYRVEVYDINHATAEQHGSVTGYDKYPTGLITAISNPIWNDEYNWNNN